MFCKWYGQVYIYAYTNLILDNTPYYCVYIVIQNLLILSDDDIMPKKVEILLKYSVCYVRFFSSTVYLYQCTFLIKWFNKVNVVIMNTFISTLLCLLHLFTTDLVQLLIIAVASVFNFHTLINLKHQSYYFESSNTLLFFRSTKLTVQF